LLIVLSSFACACAQENKRCIVSQFSYTGPVDRTDMIRHQQLRETVIYFLKKSGFDVAGDFLLGRRKIDSEYLPLERLRDLDRDALLVNLVYDGHLHIQINQGEIRTSTKSIFRTTPISSYLISLAHWVTI